MKVHLVDGTYELFRTYFGAPPATGAGGAEVGAVRGLVSTLCSLLREKEVTHVACAFDTVIESFRNRMFAGYKSGEGLDPVLLGQFALAERAVAALGVVVWSMTEFEADDALATGAARYGADAEDRVEQVVICSPDKDMLQCVRGQRVVCLDRRRKIVYDESGAYEKLGVRPASVPDYLALVGDTADGIPGLPRFGAKTAARLIAHYGLLEAIPDDAADWEVEIRGAKGLAEILRAHRTDAEFYRELATLRTDVPLEDDLEDLRWNGGRPELLRSLAIDLNDLDLTDRVMRL